MTPLTQKTAKERVVANYKAIKNQRDITHDRDNHLSFEIINISLIVWAAICSHVCVRYSKGSQRTIWLLMVLAALSLSFYLGRYSNDGFWPSFYTSISIYFLGCIATPWLDLIRQQYRVK
ncbi:MAG: hypothetical protein ACJA0M_001415 [Chitinophagales bacterium]